MQASGWPTNCDQIRVTEVCMRGKHFELQLAASWPGALHQSPGENKLKTLELNDNCSQAVWIEDEESGKQNKWITGSADGAGFIHGMSFTMGKGCKLKAFTFTFTFKNIYTQHIYINIYMESALLT